MWVCSKCREELEDQFDSCWNCGTGCDGSKPYSSFIEPEAVNAVRGDSSLQSVPLPELPVYPSATKPLAILLSRYIDRTIGINYEEPKKYSPAILKQVTDDFLSIFVSERRTTITYPLNKVLNVVEAEGGIATGLFFRKQYVVIIEVFHMVIYSGAVGISMPIPTE